MRDQTLIFISSNRKSSWKLDFCILQKTQKINNPLTYSNLWALTFILFTVQECSKKSHLVNEIVFETFIVSCLAACLGSSCQLHFLSIKASEPQLWFSQRASEVFQKSLHFLLKIIVRYVLLKEKPHWTYLTLPIFPWQYMIEIVKRSL